MAGAKSWRLATLTTGAKIYIYLTLYLTLTIVIVDCHDNDNILDNARGRSLIDFLADDILVPDDNFGDNLTVPARNYSSTWTIEQLQNYAFPYWSSSDQGMAICKAGGFLNDIALLEGDIRWLRRMQRHRQRAYRSPNRRRTHHGHHHHHHSVQHHQHQHQPRVGRRRRAATGRTERVWPHAVIPYQIPANFSGEKASMFLRAMRHWENHTCVSFVEKQPNDNFDNYIVFTVADCGCCSFVGRRGDGAQAISIGKNCDKFGIVVHELGHVIGFWHEHTRPDRDQFVDIFYHNIQHGQDYNFEKLKPDEVNSLGEPYDYSSIMHYARDTFSRGFNIDTILPKPNSVTGYRPEIGQRLKLSPGDIVQTHKLYKCPACGRTLLDARGTIAISTELKGTAERNAHPPTVVQRDQPISDETTEFSANRRKKRSLDEFEVRTEGGKTTDVQAPTQRRSRTRRTAKRHCQWRIIASRGETVTVNVTQLVLPELGVGAECKRATENYLEIRDGFYAGSPLIARLCGSRHTPSVFSSSGERLWVEFRASASPLDQPDAGLVGPDSMDALATSILQPVPSLYLTYYMRCGGVLAADRGVIESPGYPHDYRANVDCWWDILVPQGYQVAVKFNLFELEGHDDCIYDRLEIYSGAEENAHQIALYCGSQKAQPNGKGTIPRGDLNSTHNKMRIHFVSDNTVQKKGFSLMFIKEFDECQTGEHGCEQKCVNELGGYRCECDIGFELAPDQRRCDAACGGYIKADNGTVTSPNFPNLYPANKKCVWEIEALPSYKITLNFTHFEVEGMNNECNYDSVEVISVGISGKAAKRHGIFCGKGAQPAVTSETNRLRLIFSSDSTVQKSGFAAIFFTDRDECDLNNGGCQQICKNTIGSYACECHSGYVLAEDGHNCKEGGCKHQIDAPNGLVHSPNYPHHYMDKQTCIWHIVTTPGHRIQLEFDDFELERHQTCRYDRVEFYDGSSESATELARFCGTKRPAPVRTGGNELYMVFTTDNSVSRKGFKAQYTSVCGGELHAVESVGFIYSHAIYGGGQYPTKQACSWTIHAPTSDMAVRLRFTNFDLEHEGNCEYDYVEVFDGEQTFGRFCGNVNPSVFTSSSSTLRLEFHSDDSVVHKGFVAEYFAAEPGAGPTPPTATVTPHPLEPVINEKENNYNFMQR